MASPQFRYTPLDQTQADAFRLLTLIPGDDGKLVQCRLTAHLRHTAPSYRALSYTWGDEAPIQVIQINELDLFVTPNLHSALENFRPKAGTETQPQTLWIDFICINQADVLERNRQVGQMQEIFAGADEVLVWLGSASLTISLGFAFIEELCRRLDQFGIRTGDDVDLSKYKWVDVGKCVEAFLGDDFQDTWNAVAEIMFRPWWQRAWIIQGMFYRRNFLH